MSGRCPPHPPHPHPSLRQYGHTWRTSSCQHLVAGQVCVCVCVRVHVCVCMHVRVCMRVCVCTHFCPVVYMYIMAVPGTLTSSRHSSNFFSSAMSSGVLPSLFSVSVRRRGGKEDGRERGGSDRGKWGEKGRGESIHVQVYLSS